MYPLVFLAIVQVVRKRQKVYNLHDGKGIMPTIIVGILWGNVQAAGWFI
jgi:hypothetical protein